MRNLAIAASWMLMCCDSPRPALNDEPDVVNDTRAGDTAETATPVDSSTVTAPFADTLTSADTAVDTRLVKDAGPSETSQQPAGSPARCGLQPSGEYIGPCELVLAEDWRSTLCDEAAGVCVAPEANCAGGWCYVPPRSYLSGVGRDRARSNGLPTAITIVPRGFYIAQTETTVGAFEAVMGYVPDATTTCGPECPVGGVTIFEAMAFANAKSKAEGLSACYHLTGCGHHVFNHPLLGHEMTSWWCEGSTFAGPSCEGYRLPSRAEWELAAGGGSPYCLPRGPTHGDIEFICTAVPEITPWAIFCANADAGYRPCAVEFEQWVAYGVQMTFCVGPVPIRTTRPNAFGLYEMVGNVEEYTQTHFARAYDAWASEYSDGPYELAPGEEFQRVIGPDDQVHIMGGNWSWSLPAPCRWSSAGWTLIHRNHLSYPAIGFRLVRTAPGSVTPRAGGR